MKIKTSASPSLKIDKTAFSVASSFDDSEERTYWLSRTPHERLQHIEVLRRINYGHKATARLQRVLEVAEHSWH
jgi:hypothetical protein